LLRRAVGPDGRRAAASAISGLADPVHASARAFHPLSQACPNHTNAKISPANAAKLAGATLCRPTCVRQGDRATSLHGCFRTGMTYEGSLRVSGLYRKRRVQTV